MKIIKPLNHIKIVPRWIIFMFDIAVSACAFLLAFTLYNNFNVDSFSKTDFSIEFLFCMTLTAISFLVFKLYSGIVPVSRSSLNTPNPLGMAERMPSYMVQVI